MVHCLHSQYPIEQMQVELDAQILWDAPLVNQYLYCIIRNQSSKEKKDNSGEGTVTQVILEIAGVVFPDLANKDVPAYVYISLSPLTYLLRAIF